ncbi:hypothetical protein EI94DRAFT_1699434 [Lactarius quietus]|nr:hypothetical protein EI94DRAFT_1699434 [Lactarius quietus]
MAQPSKLAQVQSHQGGANASSSRSSGPAQLSGDTDEPSPFDFLNYVPSPVTEQDARMPQAPEPPHVPQSTGDSDMFEFLDHIPSSVVGPPQMRHYFILQSPITSSGLPVSTASAVGQSTYAFLDFLPSPVVRPVQGTPGIVTEASASGQQGVCMPSTASSAHASAPRATPVPTAATHGIQHTDTSRSTASVLPGPTSGLAAISGAAKRPAAYNFLQHIPASQRMAHDRTASLVCTNMEVDADPQPPVADDVGPESEEEDGEMEDDSRQELPVPLSTLVPWPEIRIPIHLPQMPAVSPEVAVVLDAHTGILRGLLNDMHRLRELMNTMNERLVSDTVVVEYLIAHLTQRE